VVDVMVLADVQHPRVVSLTLNPTLDTVTTIDRVVDTHKMRCGPTQIHPGGGGINVSRVTHRLGVASLAVFPAGGLTGQRVCSLLSEEGVPQDCVATDVETRGALAVRETSTGKDFRFTLPMSGQLPEAVWRECVQRFQTHAAGQDYAVVSGSLPDGVAPAVYGDLALWARANGVRLVLDSSGPALRAALNAGVYLFKPSLRELCDLVGRPLRNPSEWRAAARACIAQGQAQVIALTLGGDGADLIGAEFAWRSPALPVKTLTTVGAGDSFVGGLISGLVQSQPLREAYRTAMAASAAALMAPGTALCRPEDVRLLLAQVQWSD
jgi:6-phosphofructokinase 2